MYVIPDTPIQVQIQVRFSFLSWLLFQKNFFFKLERQNFILGKVLDNIEVSFKKSKKFCEAEFIFSYYLLRRMKTTLTFTTWDSFQNIQSKTRTLILCNVEDFRFWKKNIFL